MPTARPHQQRRSFRFSFGLDKLGLVALAAPYVSAVVILILSMMAVYGVSILKVDDSLSELFRTDTEEFRQYEQIDRLFPSSEYDVLVVVEGENLLSREAIRRFADATIELQLSDGVGGLVSMLSARGKPDENGYAAPIVPDEIPDDGPAYEAVLEQLRTNDIVKGKFLSDDGTLALIVISLDRQTVAEQSLRTVIDGLKQATETSFAGSDLNVKFTGAPVMQLEIRNAVERDRLIYNGLGFLVGLVVAYLFFRRLSLTLIAVAGPAIAILWTLGVIGALDFRLNLFINVITPLILVQGFSDSMHLVLAVRRAVMAGEDRFAAARAAVIDVAPACLLTAMNAAIAILSLSLADSALIRTFGKAALLAVAISYIAVAVVVPTLAVLLVRKEEKTIAHPDDETGGVGVLQRVTDAVVGFSARHPVSLSLFGIAAVVATGLIYSTLEPRYRLADQVPDQEQALAGSARLDSKLTGANPVHVMIELPKAAAKTGQPAGLYDEETLNVIAEAHRVLEERAGLGNVWSLDSLRRWLAEAGDTSVETIKRYVSILPEHLVRRFISADERAVLVTARLPDIDASEILPVVDKIDEALNPVRAAHPEYTVSVTGLPAIAARNSATLISELNWGLVGDMFVIFIFLALALRSVLAGVASVLPSLFPIFATGTLLWAFGEGMQFASIVAITVAFSLAIDSTIHFLNRYHLEEDRLDGGPGGHLEALRQTAHHIGPAVVMTTIILALGLGVTVLSDLPSLRLFGQLTAACLVSSLIAQLIILPATISLYRQTFPRSHPAPVPDPRQAGP
ncbi:MAG: MMPL family transporter [Alphaproteobacteria bacterium]|nr:MMPL family transporter [Alphaproteobacteria bacterium]